MGLQSARLDTTRPFNRADARAAGISPRQLAGPRYQRICYNVYLSAQVKVRTEERACAALAISGPSSYASHHTAAQLWGGCAPPSEHVHVSVPPHHPRTERQGVKAHRAGRADQVRTRSGIPLSSPIECFRELAATGTGLVDLVVLGDSLVAAGHFSPKHLIRAAADWVGFGVRVARRAARLVRSGVDSPMESRLRLLVVLAGLPEPEVNAMIRDDNGEWVMRFDLSYPGLKMLIEYDGRQHGDDSGQWRRDARRRESLDRLGWRMIVIHADDIYARPLETLYRIRSLMLELGAKGLRRTFLPGWSAYFPGHQAA